MKVCVVLVFATLITLAVAVSDTQRHGKLHRALATHSSLRGQRHGTAPHQYTNDWNIKMHEHLDNGKIAAFVASVNRQLTAGVLTLLHTARMDDGLTLLTVKANGFVVPRELTAVLMSEQYTADTTGHGVLWFHRDAVTSRRPR